MCVKVFKWVSANILHVWSDLPWGKVCSCVGTLRMSGHQVVIRIHNLPGTKRSVCMLLLCKVNYVRNINMCHLTINVCLIPTKMKCECRLAFSVTLGWDSIVKLLFHYRWHRVVIHKQQKGNTHPQLQLYVVIRWFVMWRYKESSSHGTLYS
jgi:hypothetical protein